ncbi:energy transducer TonB [uncultured Parabacteroides sp.]|uniref:energy transducer TonB family protein n=1 Tax=uncultured Parabacteroides sp. TaxID=512312 RepID=UPI0025E502FA|nr:energy transducer TonB [uncultured Parabacteroides sp.]
MNTNYIIITIGILMLLVSSCSDSQSGKGRSLDDCPIVATQEMIGNDNTSEQVEMQPIKQKEPASEKTESSKQDNKASIKETPKQEKPEMPYYTAYLENWESYFRTNNKYKDWDSKDAKMTMITATIDKYGKPHDVKVLRSCNVKKLDEEAIRLIREATTISPAKTEQGEDIEMKKWVIPVYFPPK